MTIRNVSTEDVRVGLRDILDQALAGDEIVIERYHKPTAVVISHSAWQMWQEERRRLRLLEMQQEAKQILAQIDAGKMETISHETLMQLMVEKRAEGSAGHVAA